MTSQTAGMCDRDKGRAENLEWLPTMHGIQQQVNGIGLVMR